MTTTRCSMAIPHSVHMDRGVADGEGEGGTRRDAESDAMAASVATPNGCLGLGHQGIGLGVREGARA